jgi:hypothetical protein
MVNMSNKNDLNFYWEKLNQYQSAIVKKEYELDKAHQECYKLWWHNFLFETKLDEDGEEKTYISASQLKYLDTEFFPKAFPFKKI